MSLCFGSEYVYCRNVFYDNNQPTKRLSLMKLCLFANRVYVSAKPCHGPHILCGTLFAHSTCVCSHQVISVKADSVAVLYVQRRGASAHSSFIFSRACSLCLSDCIHRSVTQLKTREDETALVFWTSMKLIETQDVEWYHLDYVFYVTDDLGRSSSLCKL